MSLSGNPSVSPLGEDVCPLIGLDLTIHSPASENSDCKLVLDLPADACATQKTITTNATSFGVLDIILLSMLLMKYQPLIAVKCLTKSSISNWLNMTP